MALPYVPLDTYKNALKGADEVVAKVARTLALLNTKPECIVLLAEMISLSQHPKSNVKLTPISGAKYFKDTDLKQALRKTSENVLDAFKKSQAAGKQIIPIIQKCKEQVIDVAAGVIEAEQHVGSYYVKMVTVYIDDMVKKSSKVAKLTASLEPFVKSILEQVNELLETITHSRACVDNDHELHSRSDKEVPTTSSSDFQQVFGLLKQTFKVLVKFSDVARTLVYFISELSIIAGPVFFTAVQSYAAKAAALLKRTQKTKAMKDIIVSQSISVYLLSFQVDMIAASHDDINASYLEKNVNLLTYVLDGAEDDDQNKKMLDEVRVATNDAPNWIKSIEGQLKIEYERFIKQLC